MYFAFVFSEHIAIDSSEESLKVCEQNFLPVQFQFVAFDVVLSRGFVK